MQPWFWWLVAVMGMVGIALFGVSYFQFEEQGKQHRRWELAIGLVGLALIGWAVVLAIVGAVISVVQVLS